MGNRYKKTSLKDLGVKLIDCDHQTPKAIENGIPYIGIPQMDNGRINFEAKPRLISEEDLIKWTRKANPTYGDIILSRRCNSGETVYVPKNRRFALGQNLVLLRPSGDNIVPEYLRHAVKSKEWWDEVSRYLNPGAIFESLKCADIPKFLIPEPPLESQKKISEILSSLEDRMELNQQTNNTLEQMAQALFKSWFVDFDPVIDNALLTGNTIPDELQARAKVRKKVIAERATTAKLKPLPEDIQQLFPSEFKHCGDESLGIQGWIPNGWQFKTIDELNTINPESWTSKNAPEFVKYVDLGNAKNGTVLDVANFSFNEAPSRARRILKVHDTIIGVVRPVNRSFAYINLDGLTGSTGFAVVRANQESYRAFAYFTLTSDDCINEFTRIADGAAYPAIKPDDVAKAFCLYSSEPILSEFENLVGQYLLKKSINEKQLQTLKSIRDTLLPKLISGEIII